MHVKKMINPDEVNDRYKPTYHASTSSGWGNDPNGLIWYAGKAHLFFQHNPYAPTWGRMHWGHLISQDLVRWETQPIALKPGKWYDNGMGCFSGTAIEKDGRLWLMYTGVTVLRQRQCLAMSEDGIRFRKFVHNPVITAAQLPIGVSKLNFRDPKVFYRKGQYYCLVGTKYKKKGNILLFCSYNLKKWKYVGHLIHQSGQRDHRPIKGVFECPDYQVIDGQEVLFFSSTDLAQDGIRFQNAQSSIYLTGMLNFKTGEFRYDRFHELDSGFDFYAPQTMKLPDERIILIGWKNMWGRKYPTEKDQWVGSYTLPRELSYMNRHLYQNPIREIERYRKNEVRAGNIPICKNSKVKVEGIYGNKIELLVNINVETARQVGIKLLQGLRNETVIYYDRDTDVIVFDRSRSGIEITGKEKDSVIRRSSIELKEGILKLRIFVDISSIEIFINDGYKVMTGNIYPASRTDIGVEFFCKGGNSKIIEVTKYDIDCKF